MKKQILLCSVMAGLFGAAMSSPGQSAYFQAVTNLNPTAYWPMHETSAPLVGNIETNYGSLGVLGNAYFGDWETNTAAVTRQVGGALANDPNQAMAFSGARPSFLMVPHTSAATTLNPPFTIECWINPLNLNFGDFIAQAGASQNGPGNDGNKYGIRMLWQGNNKTAPAMQVFVGTGSGQTTIATDPVSNPLTANRWYYVVLTADIQNSQTNFTLYLDGSVAASGTSAFVPTTWDPLTIGGGWWDTKGFPYRMFPGSVDEVAIYTKVLDSTAIVTHLTAGTSGAAGAYFSAVQSSGPLLYYHMDAPPYVEPDQSTWPVMANKGSTGDGVYRPGLRIGAVSGPGSFCAGFGSDVNAMPLNGMSTFGIAPYAPAYDVPYNAAGDTPFTVSAWFKGNPLDSREQRLVSHGTNSWGLRISTTGIIRLETGGSANLAGPVVNDGKWHYVVATHAATNSNAIYLDGVLAASGGGVNYTNGPGSTLPVLIGGDPCVTNTPLAVGQQFAGSVCDVAFWNGTALSAADVKTLYSAAGVPPSFNTQPVPVATVNESSAYTNTAVVVGSETLAYQWYLNGVARTGQTNASLVLNPVQQGDGGSWYLVVTNLYGSATSSIVSLTVVSLPVITSQSSGPMTLFAGAQGQFWVQAGGAQPLSYQWRSNSIAIPGATNANYVLSNAPVGYTASIVCVITNVASAITSAPVSVTVIAAPTAPYAMAVMADNPVGYWRMNEADNGLGTGNAGVITHDYWGGMNGVYTNCGLGKGSYSYNTDPSETSAEFGLAGWSQDSYAGRINGLDFSAPTNSSSNFSLEAWVYGTGQSIGGAGIITKGYGGGGEQFCISYQNASGGIRFFVRDAAGVTYSCSSGVSPDNAWNHVVAVCDESNGVIQLYVNGRMMGSGTITPGSGILATSLPMNIGSRPSNSTTNSNNLQFFGDIGEVAAYRYALSDAQVKQHYIAAGAAPFLTQVPIATAQTNAGASLIIPAAAMGTPPLTATWYDMTHGTNVSQTIVTTTNFVDSTLVLGSVPAGWDGTTLQLTVQNNIGSTNVNVNFAVISGLPTFIKNLPPTVTALATKPFIYSVAVQGTEPFTYRWYSNSVLVAGQTGSSFTLNPATAGTYMVQVSNPNGSANSQLSVLTTVPQLTNSYASGLLAFQPAGYWPLQETFAPALVAMETNYGTLGAIGNAYYASSNLTFGQTGALTDGDTSVAVTGANNSYAFVPRKNPSLTLQPPLTLECWVLPSSTASGTCDIIGQGGSGLNSAPNAGDFAGIRMGFGAASGDGDALQFFAYNGNGNGGVYNVGNTNIETPPGSVSRTAWNHCVATYDGDTVLLYVNGQLLASGNTTMAIDTWSPLVIGGGRWQGQAPTRRFNGNLDEVAIYTNVLSQADINSHYQAGITAGSDYKQLVLSSHPTFYYRMDAPAWITPDPSLFPAAVNYGSAAPNGAYGPGIVPGGVAGPSIAGLSSSLAAPVSGIIGGVDAGYDVAFNPSGTQPFTAMTWFKGYPSDGRLQSLMAHGTNWSLNLNGTNGLLVWSTSVQTTSVGLFNDGQWHLVAGVYDGTNNNLYVDGALNATTPVSTPLASEPGVDLYLGGNADLTTVSSNQRFFAGDLAQAAVFTNALTAAQVKSVYDLATVPPVPTISAVRSGGNLVITYTGTLVASPTVNGSYTPVSGASSPYTVPASASQMFYRSSNP